MTRVPMTDHDGAELVRILAHNPPLMDKWLEFDALLMNTGVLPPKLKYKVQMAMAAGGGCEFCRSMIAPLGADDSRESLAVAYAEFFQADPGSINDGHFEVLYAEFTVPEVVELCTVVTLRDAGLRLGHVWGLTPASEETRAEYVQVIEQAQARWEAGETGGAASLWQRQSADVA